MPDTLYYPNQKSKLGKGRGKYNNDVIGIFTKIPTYEASSEYKSYLKKDIKKISSEMFFINIKTFTFQFDEALKNIAEAITESKVLLNEVSLDEDMEVVDFDTYISAVSFLHVYSTSIFNETYPRKILVTPYIDSMMNGDIYLDWKTDKANFLIIFKKDRNISYFYGETKEDKIPFKSAIHNNAGVKSFLSDWFKENLCI